MLGPNPDVKYPIPGDMNVQFIRNTITKPNIIVGDYSYYNALDGESFDPTERSILVAIAREETNRTISEELAISQRTVEARISSLTQKLGVRSRIGAVVRGYGSVCCPPFLD